MKRIILYLLAALLANTALAAQEIVEIAPPHRAADTATQNIRRVSNDTGESPEIAAGETAILDRETNEWIVRPDPFPPMNRSWADLYMEGGWECMTLMTLCLVAMLFAAWKAPRWVAELGKLALLIGTFYLMTGMYGIFDLAGSNGIDLSFSILSSGYRVALIAPMYGMIIYGISLILRIALKPRI
ncbi:MAG: hypothetical protein K2O55_05060 [Alistipes sp.]|nr:hypothetical protein [Alistipes sp.]